MSAKYQKFKESLKELAPAYIYIICALLYDVLL